MTADQFGLSLTILLRLSSAYERISDENLRFTGNRLTTPAFSCAHSRGYHLPETAVPCVR